MSLFFSFYLLYTSLLDTHRRLLEHSSVEVRIVAGENIALLLEGLDDDVRVYHAILFYVNIIYSVP
jgi:hypothetical protein